MRTQSRCELGVLGAVAGAFAGFLALAFATAGSPDTAEEGYLPLVIIWSVFATPSLIAAHLVFRTWWTRRAGAARPSSDTPARLLTLAVAALPVHRRAWGEAMNAELAQVAGPTARMRFAAGCARAALFPPPAHQNPVLAAGVATVWTVFAVGLSVGQALPAMRLFAMTFAALVGAFGTLALARSHRVRRPASGPTVAAVGLAGVAAAVALTAHVLTQAPAQSQALGSAQAVLLAGYLAGCLGLVLAPPRALTTSRAARRVGLATALTLVGCFLLASRQQNVWFPFLFLAPIGIPFLASAVTAAVRRSFRAGVQTTVWTAVLGTLLLFVFWLVESLHWYGVDGRLLLDGEGGYPVSTNLKDAVFWVLVFTPAWGLLPFGIFGAALGSRLPRLLTLVR